MRKLLLVDDESQIVEFLSNFLQRKHIQVYQATNSDKALHIFRKEAPNLILLDINMPGLDGFELLKIIRKEDKNVKIIMVTGNEDKASMKESLQLGADDYISKPLDLKDLHKRVSEILEV